MRRSRTVINGFVIADTFSYSNPAGQKIKIFNQILFSLVPTPNQKGLRQKMDKHTWAVALLVH
jgi:hypothetical protein